MSSFDKQQQSYLNQFSLNMLKLTSAKAQNTTNSITSNQNQPTTDLAYNLPLSIEFLRKLKRPTNIPYHLEYSNGQVFQGSLLEDWLMQSLEDHINNSCINLTNTTNSMALNTNRHHVKCVPVTAEQRESITEEPTLNIPGLITTPSTATNSATSLVIEITSSTANQNEYEITNEQNSAVVISHDYSENKNDAKRTLNSDSYKAAISNLCDRNSVASLNELCATPNAANVTTSSSSITSNSEQMSNSVNQLQVNLIYKRQEANYYVQQILTNLLAIGVLEYESGFENAINKTFKVC